MFMSETSLQIDSSRLEALRKTLRNVRDLSIRIDVRLIRVLAAPGTVGEENSSLSPSRLTRFLAPEQPTVCETTYYLHLGTLTRLWMVSERKLIRRRINLRATAKMRMLGKSA